MTKARPGTSVQLYVFLRVLLMYSEVTSDRVMDSSPAYDFTSPGPHVNTGRAGGVYGGPGCAE